MGRYKEMVDRNHYPTQRQQPQPQPQPQHQRGSKPRDDREQEDDPYHDDVIHPRLRTPSREEARIPETGYVDADANDGGDEPAPPVEEGDQDEDDGVDKIYEFPIEKLQTNRRVAIIGKTGSGKTVMLMELVAYLCKHFDAGMAWTPTTSSANDFRTFMPDSCIHEKFNRETITACLEELMETLRDLVARGIK